MPAPFAHASARQGACATPAMGFSLRDAASAFTDRERQKDARPRPVDAISHWNSYSERFECSH
jgi:hypothetical protein